MLDEITRIRTEVKFAVDDLQAEHLAEELGTFLAPVRQSWITTLYLDRPDRGLSMAVRSSPTINVKIRLRDYADPESLWLEIKRRAGRSSEKVRVRLPRRALRPFLGGRDVSAALLEARDSRRTAEEVLEAWREIRRFLPGAAVPVGAVCFFRRSLESGDPRVRATIDRDISYHRISTVEGGEPLGLPLAREEGGTLEVKYGTFQPAWLPGVARRLAPAASSKFLSLLRHVDQF